MSSVTMMTDQMHALSVKQKRDMCWMTEEHRDYLQQIRREKLENGRPQEAQELESEIRSLENQAEELHQAAEAQEQEGE